MLPLSVLLIHIAVIIFLIYNFFKKKPLKWNKLLEYSTFKGEKHIPGPLVLPFIGTKWQKIKMNKLHEYYEGGKN